jgi:hypothetical protein
MSAPWKRLFIAGLALVVCMVLACAGWVFYEYARWLHGENEAEWRFQQIETGMEFPEARERLGDGQWNDYCPHSRDGPLVKGTAFYCWESDDHYQIWVGLEGTRVVDKWMRRPSL